MIDSRLDRGWNADLRRWLCNEGRINAESARFTSSPSTVPIRTREFVIADLRAFSLFDWYGAAEPCRLCCAPKLFLCKLHRKEPGCVDGEHIHVLFCPAAPLTDGNGLRPPCLCTPWLRGEAVAMDRPPTGDADLSKENLTADADCFESQATEGEFDLSINVGVREEKAAVVEANGNPAVDDLAGDDVW